MMHNDEEAEKIQAKINDDAEKLYNDIDNVISEFVKGYDENVSATTQIILKGSSGERVIGMGTIPLTIFSAVSTILTKLAVLGGMEREDLLCLVDGLVLSNLELKEKAKVNDALCNLDTPLPN